MIKLVAILNEIQVQGKVTPEMCNDLIDNKIDWDNYNLARDIHKTQLYNLLLKSKGNFKKLDYQTLVSMYKELQGIYKEYPKNINEIQVRGPVTPEEVMGTIQKTNFDQVDSDMALHNSDMIKDWLKDYKINGGLTVSDWLHTVDKNKLRHYYEEMKNIFQKYSK